ncbi:otoferlin [Trichonephila inaurata madagascariensis]|uniref:Otoferlin n=1 Tax=Trichonephila inaurata madagascariensis TaxID=2747483 RepID=A0A8X6Y6Z5_9ARAC|nr:otoferlin [Trichonephila inaurata madagascariensis]
MSKKNLFFQLWERGRSLKLTIDNLFDDDDEDTDEEKDSQFALLSVKIYRADGLPSFNRCFLSQIKKRCAMENGVFIDPYVQVFFAGLKGSTSKRKRTLSPEWNEEIVFTTKFPLPTEPIVVQVRDDDFVINNDIGTVAIPLDKISCSDEHGFLPNFGPSYVYLRDQKNPEDVNYNGRLLMAITTEIFEGNLYTKSDVKLDQTIPPPEVSTYLPKMSTARCCTLPT